MPCIGPSEPSKEQIEKVYNSIIDLLVKENHIIPPDCYYMFKEEADKSFSKLKKVIGEILKWDNYEEF